DHVTLLTCVPARALQRRARRHGGQSFVHELDRQVRVGRGERGHEGACHGRRRGLATLERCRESHHHSHRRVLLDELVEPPQFVFPPRIAARDRDGLYGCGEDAVGIARRHPDTGGAHVEAQSSTPRPAPTGGRRSGPRHPASRTASRNAVAAASIAAGSVPAPCAMSGFPPPRAPSAGAMALTRSPARRPRSCAAPLTAMTKGTLSAVGAVRHTTPASPPSRPLRAAPSRRGSPAAAPSAECVRNRMPARSSADARISPAREASCAARSDSRVFSVSRSLAVSAATRSGNSSAGALSEVARPETSARSRAWCRYASMPTYASTRRIPEPSEDSPRRLTGPIREVLDTCVPPHSSMEKGPPISTPRTREP